MKWLITRGLCLALGLLAARVYADDVEWRPARPASTAPTEAGAARLSSFVTLHRPVVATPSDSGGEIRQVDFHAVDLDNAQPLVRFQRADAPQPMPTGPALGGEEILVAPRPLPRNGRPPANDQPDIVSRWVGETPDIWGGGPPPAVGHGTAIITGPPGPALLGHDDCGCGCGSACGDECGPLCCDECCPSCCDCCCCPGGCCKDRGCFWVSGEYLLWAFKRDTVPPLVTVAPQNVFPAIGTGGSVLVGGGTIDNGPFSGGRFTAGYWTRCCPCWGIEGSYFFLAQRESTFTISSNGNPSIGRPIVMVNGNYPGETAQQVAFAPTGTSGGVSVLDSSELWGLELNGRYKWCCGECYHLDFLTGLRYVDLKEKLYISENPTQNGTAFVISDRFDTHNQFFGYQIGVDFEYRWRHWYLQTTAKLALGDDHEEVHVAGDTRITTPGGTTVFQNGGLLALASNIGTFSKDRFAVIPELGLKIGYQVTDHLRIYAGYDFLYISSVVRPGPQVDRMINTNQLPSLFGGTKLVQPALPAVQFRETDFWAQGLNAGLEWRY
jgi:hypothetical protein